MKVDLNKEVNIESGARAIFIASFAAFIFTSLFATSIASSSSMRLDAAASVAMSNKYALGETVNINAGVKNEGEKDSLKKSDAIILDASAIKPKVSIKAINTKINSNNATKIVWESESVMSCIVDKDGIQFSKLTSTTKSGISTGVLTKDTLFTINCESDVGKVSASAKITVIAVPITSVTISAEKTELDYGQNTNIIWKSENAKTCSVKKGLSNFSTRLNSATTDKTNSGALHTDTIFSISCAGAGGVSTASVEIKVKPPVLPTAKINVSSTTISGDEKLNVSWSSTGANKCAIMSGTRNIGNSISGKVDSLSIKESSVVWITCSSSVGTAVDSASIQYLKNQVKK